MFDVTIRFRSALNRVSLTSLFFWLAVAIVCISLIAAYRLGIERGLRDTIGSGNWGRILFGVGTAITEMEHGGHGYVLSTFIETVLTYVGLTDDAAILASLGSKFPNNLHDPSLINAAIEKAVHFKWPFNPDEAIRGSGGDDLGFVDYVRISFYLFGYRMQSLYYTYFLLFGISATAYLYAFRFRPAVLMLLISTCVAQIFLLSSDLFASHNLGSIADPRVLSVLAVVPGLHLGCSMLNRLPPSYGNVILAIVQSLILIFALWVRASAVWAVLAVVVLGSSLAICGLSRRRFKLVLIWAAGILLAGLTLHLIWVTTALHPIYKNKGEISHHVFWHAVFYQLQFHPQWNKKYAASYDFATFDELPPIAAKKYLLRHPPANPDEVYLTQDHLYLRVAASETYIRKAYFEFFVSDPKFVLESLFIYNPRAAIVVFGGYLSSLKQTTVILSIAGLVVGIIMAGFLATDNDQRRLFKNGALMATGGFFVSLSPILITVPNYPTMGDQYFVLLIVLGCWTVLALATGLHLVIEQTRIA